MFAFSVLFLMSGKQSSSTIFIMSILQRKLLNVITLGPYIFYHSYQMITLTQGCTSQISSGPKKTLGAYPRAKIDIFVTSLREIFQANRLNRWHFGLCGPNKKLPRATFCPRAQCCARLPQLIKKLEIQFNRKLYILRVAIFLRGVVRF